MVVSYSVSLGIKLSGGRIPLGTGLSVPSRSTMGTTQWRTFGTESFTWGEASNCRLCLHRHVIGWHLHLLGGNTKREAKRSHSFIEARSQEGLQNNKPNIMNKVLDNTGAQTREASSSGRINFIRRCLTLVGFQYGTCCLSNFRRRNYSDGS